MGPIKDTNAMASSLKKITTIERKKMDANQKIFITDMKAKLSTLWIFVLLNIIFRDIHEFFRPGLLEEMMTGVVNGTQVTEE